LPTPLTLLTIFNSASSVTNKNPLGSIAAFRGAFVDDTTTRPIVKTSNASDLHDAIGS